MLIKLLKGNLFFQNFASWVTSKIPCVVEHNLGKYHALKKAFYLTALEQLQGDYLEFGVFTGSSFVLAMRAHKKLKYLGKLDTKFYGFDSFSGFGKVSKEDAHPFYLDDIFNIDAERVTRNIKKKSKGLDVKIVEGFFEETIKDKHPSQFDMSAARIVFIDCDLKEPAQIVFSFIKPIIQQGMILVMDDFYSYRGDSCLGVSGAYKKFCEENQNIKWRKVFDYGYGGIAYMVSGIEK